jgi:hypothetical protein
VVLALNLTAWLASPAFGTDPWVVYKGSDGMGKGKHVVLVSGDEEYRSEEALPQLAKILAVRHGFTCTVLFAIGQDGTIDPDRNDNIPGLEALRSADLMIIATRFRNLPDDQMKEVVDYVDSGRPIIGMRTATHAFNLKSKTYANYSWNSKDWVGGFGREVLGETWVAHHGHHGVESTRGILAPGAKDHPILRGIHDGDIWGPTDVYEAHPPTHCRPLVLGQVLKGMKPDDPPVEGKKNDPMMPVAWFTSFTSRSSRPARIFTTTMGAATDLEREGTRRLLVNAVYWAVGLEDKIPEQSDVALVGDYHPLPFGFKKAKKGVKPEDHAIPPKASLDGTGPGWKTLGEDDFARVNCAPETWTWKDDVLHCTGRPVGVLRTSKPVTNFELVAEWKHLQSGGNSGIFVWAPEKALEGIKPNSLPRGGIEVQILDHGFRERYERNSRRKGDWFTTHGDVFAVGTSKMAPFPPLSPDGSRSFPRKNLSKGVGQWNHYYVRGINGEVRLWVNGEEVSGGSGCEPRSGYLCLESEGAPVEFRNIRIRELP